MKKLIELLNEMIKSKGNCYKIIDYAGGVFIIDDKANKYRCNLYPAVVISKEYGFIQRLVKHFMINMTKIDARIALSDFNATDRMLMALAISDNPIELLIDCLE